MAITRAQLAATIHRRLRGLATDAQLSPAAAGELTEGDYTDAIDAGLRSIGAINADTDALDISLVTTAQLNTLLQLVEADMLRQLQRHYAVAVDLKAGQREEKLSQIGAAIRAMGSSSSGGSGGGGAIVVRPLKREAKDYELYGSEE